MDMNGHLDAAVLTDLRKLMGSDFATLVQTFLADSDQRVASIGAALGRGDAEAVRRAAHSFKGSASNMAAPVLADFCRQIEECGRDGDLATAAALLPELEREYVAVRSLFLAGLA